MFRIGRGEPDRETNPTSEVHGRHRRVLLRLWHQCLDDLVNREARGLLSRWELFEALEPVVHDRLRGVLERDMLDEPVVVQLPARLLARTDTYHYRRTVKSIEN